MPAIGCIPTITEAQIEQAALAWPAGLGYQTVFGPAVAPGEAMAERDDYGRVVLEYRLRQALQRLNPQVPADALEEAFRKLTQPGSPSLVVNNHVIHKYLVEGVPVEYQRADGSIGRDPARLAPCR
jgi:type I restriction enzyme R subunit